MGFIPGIQQSSRFVQNAKQPNDGKTLLTTAERLDLDNIQRWLGMMVYDADLNQWKYLINDPAGDTTVEADWADLLVSGSRPRFARQGTITTYPASVPAVADHHYFDVDTSGGDITFATLPAITNVEDGDEVTFRNIGTNNLIVDPVDVEFVQGDALTIIRDAGNTEFLQV